jgi:hypothetical protein
MKEIKSLISITVFPVVADNYQCFRGCIVWGNRYFEFIAKENIKGQIEALILEAVIQISVFGGPKASCSIASVAGEDLELLQTCV